MSTGLHARKKIAHNDDHDTDDIEQSRAAALPSGSDEGTDRSRRRYRCIRRFIRSEVGCAIEAVIGFLTVGLLLGYLILHHQHRKVVLHIIHDPLGHGAALKGRAGFRHHFFTGHPRSVTVVMPSVVNPQKRPKRLQAISDTWGPSARAVYVVHNVSEFPTASHAVLSAHSLPEDHYSYPQLMLLPDSIGIDDGVPRLIYVIRTVYEKINPDFAFFVNDHSFVIPEHLCKYLEQKIPDVDMYHGHAMKNDKLVFNSGAAGYLLSRETMKKLVQKWDEDNPLCTGREADKWLQGNPALLTTQCMKDELGVTPVDTRHHKKWHRFHAFPLTRLVTGHVDEWYNNKHKDMHQLMEDVDESYNTLLTGVDCCAQDTVSFHYVESMETKALFATREALLKNPHMTDHELKGLMIAEWPRRGEDVGAYSRGLPKENDQGDWEALLHVMRKISSRHTQGDC